MLARTPTSAVVQALYAIILFTNYITEKHIRNKNDFKKAELTATLITS